MNTTTTQNNLDKVTKALNSMNRISSLFNPVYWLTKARVAYAIANDSTLRQQELDSPQPLVHWLWLWLFSRFGLMFLVFMAYAVRMATVSFMAAISRAYTVGWEQLINNILNNTLFEFALHLPLMLVLALLVLLNLHKVEITTENLSKSKQL